MTVNDCMRNNTAAFICEHTNRHLLLSAVRVLAQVGHGDEGELQSLPRGDSALPLHLKHPLQEVDKRPPVRQLRSVVVWMDLNLETVTSVGFLLFKNV